MNLSTYSNQLVKTHSRKVDLTATRFPVQYNKKSASYKAAEHVRSILNLKKDNVQRYFLHSSRKFMVLRKVVTVNRYAEVIDICNSYVWLYVRRNSDISNVLAIKSLD